MKTLEDLCKIFGVSGNEEAVSVYIAKKATENYEAQIDNIGNLVITEKSDVRKKTIAFIAQMDEPGLIVSGYTREGLILFTVLGQLLLETLPGKSVRFKNGVEGVVIFHQQIENRNKIKATDLAIETGARDEHSAQGLVPFGELAVVDDGYLFFSNMVKARNLKSRACCGLLTEILRKKKKGSNLSSFVFSVQEELQGRGTKVLSNYFNADLIVDLTCTPTSHSSRGRGLRAEGEVVLKLPEGSISSDIQAIREVSSLFEREGIRYQWMFCHDHKPGLNPFMGDKKLPRRINLSIPLRNGGTGGEVMKIEDYHEMMRALETIMENS